MMLMERGRLQDGDHVALVYPPGKRAGPATAWDSLLLILELDDWSCCMVTKRLLTCLVTLPLEELYCMLCGFGGHK